MTVNLNNEGIMQRRELLRAAALAPVSLAAAKGVLAGGLHAPSERDADGRETYDETPEFREVADSAAKDIAAKIEETLAGRFKVEGRCQYAWGYRGEGSPKTEVTLKIEFAATRPAEIARPKMARASRLLAMLTDEEQEEISRMVYEDGSIHLAVSVIQIGSERAPVRVTYDMELVGEALDNFPEPGQGA